MRYICLIIILMAIILQSSCKGFLEIDPPKSSLVNENVFRTNDQALSALTGLYTSLRSTGYASGGINSITALTGLSADEFTGYNNNTITFHDNQLTPDFTGLIGLYSGPYQSIYTANLILERLEVPNGVTSVVKSQIKGEALFVRAFAYFYLVNLFGEVPLQLITDYRLTQVEPRAIISAIYQQILEDLNSAEVLLQEDYPTAGRVRPNKSVVQTMMARTYLYLGDWESAERYSSLVIAKAATYRLESLDAVFLAASQEAIWQLMPAVGGNTNEGSTFILQSVPTSISLRSNFVLNAFEPNDKRKDTWIRSYTNGTGTYYYPYKYKVKSPATVTEYSMVMRLAELYLIRTEARAKQNNSAGAIEDIDKLRERAGLPLFKNVSADIPKPDLLDAIQKERRIELFSEWGHRWLDLKRTGRADAVLSAIKIGWKPTAVIYPTPYNETSRNPNIVPN